MLEITVQQGNSSYVRTFPEDQKSEKKVLKFLESLRDSQFSGPHRHTYLQELKKKKKAYQFRYGRSNNNGYPRGIAEEIRPPKLKVSIIHISDSVNK
jgi:hypothetical protein